MTTWKQSYVEMLDVQLRPLTSYVSTSFPELHSSNLCLGKIIIYYITKILGQWRGVMMAREKNLNASICDTQAKILIKKDEDNRSKDWFK